MNRRSLLKALALAPFAPAVLLEAVKALEALPLDVPVFAPVGSYVLGFRIPREAIEDLTRHRYYDELAIHGEDDPIEWEEVAF